MEETRTNYKWMVLLISCIGSMMAPLDSSIVGVSLPEMAQSLHMEYAEVVWVPTAYLVTISALLLSFGRLSDLHGRKRLYILGFAIFTVSSIACSLSPNGTVLIAARIVQGIGGALLMAVAPAIITATFPGKERGKALGINAMFIYVGLSLGPPLGGFLTESFGWPFIFWVNVPIGITSLILAQVVIREEVVRREGRFDVKGAVLFAGSLTTLLLGLTFGEGSGWANPKILMLFASSFVMLYLFFRVERKAGKGAMLDLDLFMKNRLFASGNISALLNYTAYFGVSFVISFYLQRVLNLSPVQTGIILLVMPLTMAITAPLSGVASDSIGSRFLATGGMVLISAGLVVLSLLQTDSSMLHVGLGLLLLGVGMGLFSSPNTSSVMGCVPRDQLGVASGTISTMRTVGQSFSLAIMGAVMSVVAGAAVVEAVFGGGTDPVDLGGFMAGMQAAFLVAAVIALVGAITSSTRPPAEYPSD